MSRTPALLCIDDNVLGLAVRKAMLESRDYRVFIADNGPAGIEIACSEKIDLVILDYEMPEMDGSRVAQHLRGRCSHIPILLLTGFPGRIPKSLLQVVDGFIVKGSSPEVLLKEIERITSAPAKTVSAPAPLDVRGRRVKQASRARLRSRPPLRSCRQKRKRN